MKIIFGVRGCEKINYLSYRYLERGIVDFHNIETRINCADFFFG